MKEILIKANERELNLGAKLGWVFPLTLPYGEYKRAIHHLGKSPQELDQYFVSYFASNFQDNIKDPLIKHYKYVPNHLESLLNECFYAFENGHYQICVPALFSVLEGILVELSNDGDRSAIRYKQGLDNLIKNDDIEVGVLPLISISKFIEFSFSKSDFNSTDIPFLNRHWAQHGRYLQDLTEKPPLQLFNAISLVMFTQQFLKKKL
ncbi:hypothetical protein BCS65_02470 [Vibrio cyclitrophicus]|uniref:hypothetical protein n=1 Tax=Vibrio cyclitrophicus TaxID=47951 RepID=UPI000C83A1E0|nr:hypothetical protein [Vibrio cyclitrophicus]PMJ53592.1 hypothetical protein BCU19_02675 [Vibrio cyclitrophicus]